MNSCRNRSCNLGFKSTCVYSTNNSEVSIFSPWFTPRISHLPIVSSIFCTPSDYSNCVSTYYGVFRIRNINTWKKRKKLGYIFFLKKFDREHIHIRFYYEELMKRSYYMDGRYGAHWPSYTQLNSVHFREQVNNGYDWC